MKFFISVWGIILVTATGLQRRRYELAKKDPILSNRYKSEI